MVGRKRLPPPLSSHSNRAYLDFPSNFDKSADFVPHFLVSAMAEMTICHWFVHLDSLAFLT